MLKGNRGPIARTSAALLAVTLAVTGCSTNADGKGGDSAQEKTVIKVGWVPTVAWIGWLGTIDRLESDEFKLELTDFKSSSDTLVSLTNDSIDIGAVGYNVLADAIGQSDLPLQYIAGASAKSAVFLAHKDSGIKEWADLEGKRVGAVRGSAEYIHLNGALRTHAGLSVEDNTEFVNFSNGTDVILALQRGDIDATVSYEPVASEAIVGGFAINVPEMQDTLFTETFEVSSGLLASNGFLAEHPEWAVEILTHYKKTVERLENDPEMGLEIYMKYATGDPEILQAALQNVALLYGMDEEQVRRVATTLRDAGQLNEDVSDHLAEYLNYDYLSDATGETPEELGKLR